MILVAWSILMILFSEPANKGLQKDVVKVQTSKTVIEKEKTAILVVEVSVKDGYHIQANKVNDKSLVPALLNTSPIEQLEIGTPEFPPFKLFRLEGTTDDLNVFDGKFVIKVPVKAKKNVLPRSYTLKAGFYYQACDHRSCLFPRTINFEMEVVVK